MSTVPAGIVIVVARLGGGVTLTGAGAGFGFGGVAGAAVAGAKLRAKAFSRGTDRTP
ncbi:MAG: hypothetical protein QNK25_11165 [Desulfobacterales bacterium]|nr:hypothetical protein [Desulfobacterales bacterium]